MKDNRRRKGFTLMELLIVIAIIALLVAIAIPTFSKHIIESREAADIANLKSCFNKQQAEILSHGISVEEAVNEMLSLDLNYDGDNGEENKRSSTEDSVSYDAEKVDGGKTFTWTFYDN